MTKSYELPEGHRMVVDFDANGICHATVQALDSLVEKLNYYADKCEENPEKTGYWIENTKKGYLREYCSSCNGWWTYGKTDYCPFCGMKMQGYKRGDTIYDEFVEGSR